MVANPLLPGETEVKIASNSVDFMLQARVILNAQGIPQTLVLANPQLGVEMKLPAHAWPFVDGGHPVVVSLCLFQSWIEGAKLAPQLIRGS